MPVEYRPLAAASCGIVMAWTVSTDGGRGNWRKKGKKLAASEGERDKGGRVKTGGCNGVVKSVSNNNT